MGRQPYPRNFTPRPPPVPVRRRRPTDPFASTLLTAAFLLGCLLIVHMLLGMDLRKRSADLAGMRAGVERHIVDANVAELAAIPRPSIGPRTNGITLLQQHSQVGSGHSVTGSLPSPESGDSLIVVFCFDGDGHGTIVTTPSVSGQVGRTFTCTNANTNELNYGALGIGEYAGATGLEQ